MPEGPEVRRYADLLAPVLENQTLVSFIARTKAAKLWLETHPNQLLGVRITRVRARGKNLLIHFENDVFCYSHLMMWGRWQIEENSGDLPLDRRERARLSTKTHHAILMSAPIFEIRSGDPNQIETLAQIGPDALPYLDEAPFDATEFLRRLTLPENQSREIGAILLDQNVVAGLGNYLRAEILFLCQIDPWLRVEELTLQQLDDLCRQIPAVTRFAYENGGATVEDDTRQRMRDDSSLVYATGRDWGTRHWVFRRTNLPCLKCGNHVRQLRQTTRVWDDGEKSRIIYFCPTCQNTKVELKPVKKKAQVIS